MASTVDLEKLFREAGLPEGLLPLPATLPQRPLLVRSALKAALRWGEACGGLGDFRAAARTFQAGKVLAVSAAEVWRRDDLRGGGAGVVEAVRWAARMQREADTSIFLARQHMQSA
jgi:hypothetical protein